MEPFSAWYVLPAAFILDFLLGDPVLFPHPVRWMGWAVSRAEPVFRRIAVHPVASGALFAAFLVSGAWASGLFLVMAAQAIHPGLRTAMEIALLYFCISSRSLEQAAMGVYGALKKEGLEEAKRKLSRIVGRDVEPLSEEGVIRAAVETVAENLVDGVISPLFFAALGGIPFAMAFKMVSTLDSMVGYKNERYRYFGKASARMDDAANFLPARISVPVVALAGQILSRKGRNALSMGYAQGSRHSSPNAGYPEAAFAGVLGLRLGGPNDYGGKRVEKPYIGSPLEKPAVGHIPKACDLMLLSSWISLAMAWIISCFGFRIY